MGDSELNLADATLRGNDDGTYDVVVNGTVVGTYDGDKDEFQASAVQADDATVAGELDRVPGGAGYIYLLGGSTIHNGPRAERRGFENRNLVYDIERDEFQNLAPMQYGRSDMVAVEYDGGIWAFGGDSENGDKVERYDIATDTWEEKPSLNTGRNRLSTNGVVINGNAYICGGGTLGDPPTRTDVAEKYDLDNDTVTTVSSLPVTHSFPMQAAYNGYLWLCTGNSDDTTGGLIQRYDPATDTWAGPSNFSKHPKGVTDGAGMQIGDEFHMIGGWSPDESNRKPAAHYAYEFDNDNWRLVRELDTEYSHGKATFDGTYIHRFGGRMNYGNKAFTNSTWRYHLGKGLQSTAHPSASPAYNMTLVHSNTRPYGR